MSGRAHVLFPDVDAWAVSKVRAGLKAAGRTEYVGRDRKGIDSVWVVYDGGPRLDVLREQGTLRVVCQKQHWPEAHDLARLVETTLEADGRPVVLVERLSGPLEVPEDSATYVTALSIFRLTARGDQH